MVNPLKALTWRIRGHYNPEEGIQEDSPIHARNRAKYEAWKYNTFGPGKGRGDVFHRDPDLVYRIIDSGQLQQEPLFVNDPWETAGLASIIAEMEGHKFLSMMTPLGALKTREGVEREEDAAIDRFVRYLIPKNLPPYRYTEWHNDPYERLGWMNHYTPQQYPLERVIIQKEPKIREYYQRKFKEMLGKLKRHHNPQYYNPE